MFRQKSAERPTSTTTERRGQEQGDSHGAGPLAGQAQGYRSQVSFLQVEEVMAEGVGKITLHFCRRKLGFAAVLAPPELTRTKFASNWYFLVALNTNCHITTTIKWIASHQLDVWRTKNGRKPLLLQGAWLVRKPHSLRVVSQAHFSPPQPEHQPERFRDHLTSPAPRRCPEVDDPGSPPTARSGNRPPYPSGRRI